MVFRMVYTELRRPGGIRVGIRVAVLVGSRNRVSGAPVVVEIFGFEARNGGVGSRRVAQREVLGCLADVQTAADSQTDKGLVLIYSLPEIHDVSLLGCTNGAVGAPVVAGFDKIVVVRYRG